MRMFEARVKRGFVWFFLGMSLLAGAPSEGASIPATPSGSVPMRLVMERKARIRGYDARPHIIFLEHGLLASSSTFGDLGPILAQRYERARNLQWASLDYPSRPDAAIADLIAELHPYSFAKILNARMINYLVEQGIRERAECQALARESRWTPAQLQDCEAHTVSLDTPYSFIVHSQGGLVAMAYLNTCLRLRGDRRKCHYAEGRDLFAGILQAQLAGPRGSDLEVLRARAEARAFENLYAHEDLKLARDAPAQVRNLITLGTPFSGSPTANLAVKYEKVFDLLKNYLPIRQFNELAIGSPGLTWQRALVLQRKAFAEEGAGDLFGGWRNPLPPDLVVTNVAGLIPSAHFFQFIGLDYPTPFEQDLIVGAPEARLDFLYYLEPDPAKGSAARVLSGMTHAAEAYHPIQFVSHIDSSGKYLPIAEVTRNNWQVHPTYSIVMDALDRSFGIFDPKVEPASSFKRRYIERLANFTSEIKVALPQGYHRPLATLIGNVAVHPREAGVFQELLKKDAKFLGQTIVPGAGWNRQAEKIADYFYQTFFHIGTFAEKHAFYPRQDRIEDLYRQTQGGHPLDYTIDLIGFERKTFSARALPSLTSYSEVYLRPYLPIPATALPPAGTAEVGATETARFHVDAEGALWSENFRSPRATCRLGLLAAKTPPRAKFSEMSPEHRQQLGGTLVRLDYATHTDAERGLHRWMWDRYAPNQGKVFLSLRDRMAEGRAELEAGTVLEVLGRVQGENGDGRLDRYLVTSPELRKRDRLRRFAELSARAGVRWVNVVDVDLFRDADVVPLSVRGERTRGNDCVGDRLVNSVAGRELRQIARDRTYRLAKENREAYGIQGGD